MQNSKILTDLEKELTVTMGEGWEKEIVREFGMDMFTPLELKWIANKDQLCSRENCSMLCGSLEGKGVWGRRKHVYVCLSHLLST